MDENGECNDDLIRSIFSMLAEDARLERLSNVELVKEILYTGNLADNPCIIEALNRLDPEWHKRGYK